MDDNIICVAVDLWFNDQAQAESTYGHISDWDTRRVTSTAHLFEHRIAFNTVLRWNMSGVTDTSYMFRGACQYNQPMIWDMQRVVNMTGMFSCATSMNQPLVWNTRSVRRMGHMFEYAWEFDQTLVWDTSGVVDMQYIFRGANLFDSPLPWDTRSVENMSHAFSGAANFNQILDWNTDRAHPITRRYVPDHDPRDPDTWVENYDDPENKLAIQFDQQPREFNQIEFGIFAHSEFMYTAQYGEKYAANFDLPMPYNDRMERAIIQCMEDCGI